MSQNNGTGIKYPTIELGGKTYTVKFSRGAIYRLDRAGFDLQSLPKELGGWSTGKIRFSILIDLLHAAIDFRGTPEDLSELVPNDMIAPVVMAVIEAMGKMEPPAQKTIQPQAETSDLPSVQ